MSSVIVILACVAAIGGCKWFERSEQRRAARTGRASRRTARRARMIAHGIAAGSPPRWNSKTENYIKNVRAAETPSCPGGLSAARTTRRGELSLTRPAPPSRTSQK